MNGLNGFLKSDIPDLGLFGFGDAMGILDAVAKLQQNDPRRRAFYNKLRVPTTKSYAPTNNLTAKAEFEKRLNMLPNNIVQDLKTNNSQIVDGRLYGVRLIGDTTGVEVFANADVKTVGKTNINARKLEKDTPFLCTHIRLTSGVGAAGTSTVADIVAVAFGKTTANMLNGEFSLEVGKKVLLPETPMEVFATNSYTDSQAGLYKLENPKWINPQEEIVFDIKLGAAEATKTYVKVELIGATVVRN